MGPQIANSQIAKIYGTKIANPQIATFAEICCLPRRFHYDYTRVQHTVQYVNMNNWRSSFAYTRTFSRKPISLWLSVGFTRIKSNQAGTAPVCVQFAYLTKRDGFLELWRKRWLKSRLSEQQPFTKVLEQWLKRYLFTTAQFR
jgi:hypothetical protein